MVNNKDKKIKLSINKKIISIAFLLLALLMLGSVSYAYFVASVVGNDTAKKTTFTTGTVSLKLDGTKIIGTSKMAPGQQHETTFTVENTGSLDALYNIDMIEVSNTYETKRDLVYKITSDNDGGQKQETELPSESGTILHNIYIKSGVKQTYTVTVIFKDDREIQNENEGKSFAGKIQINNLDENAIATTILRNSILQTEEPDFTKGYPNPTDNDSTLSGLYAAPDDDGISYYFRGDKDFLNNNITFANKNWKILRINGDGTIRIILNDIAEDLPPTEFSKDVSQNKYDGYTYDNQKECTREHPCEVIYNNDSFSNDNFKWLDSNIKTVLETWYKKTLASYDDKIATSYFCNDTSYGGSYNGSDVHYGAWYRQEITSSPTLQCPDPKDEKGILRTYGGVYKLKIGLITVDELSVAGICYRRPADVNNYLSKSPTNKKWLWTMSPGHFHSIVDYFEGKVGGNMSSYYSTSTKNVFPVINLNTNVTFTTNGEGELGTESNPYVVN